MTEFGEQTGMALSAAGGAGLWRVVRDQADEALKLAVTERPRQLRAFRNLVRQFADISLTAIASTLAHLGEFTRTGQACTAASIAQRHNILARHIPLLRQWLSALASVSILEPAGNDHYSCVVALDGTALADQLDTELAGIHYHGAGRRITDYFVGSVSHLPELLRGETDPLQLLFPGDDAAITDAIYARNPVSATLNRVIAETVRAAALRTAGDRPLRILEFGAGTAATTTAVLDLLPSDRAVYTFTDVSTYFTDRAARRFADYPNIEYTLFDLDRDPAEQGLAVQTFDVVLGANALHAARDVHIATRHLHRLVAPGGVVLVIERTVYTPFQMVTAGFIEGFSHYADSRRALNQPLLPVDRWATTFQGAGFGAFAAQPADAETSDLLGEHLIICGVEADRSAAPTTMQDAWRPEGRVGSWKVDDV